jgi:hypothetical protein
MIQYRTKVYKYDEMICTAYMCHRSEKITILNLVNVLEDKNATLYNVVAAVPRKCTITIFSTILDVQCRILRDNGKAALMSTMIQ